MDSEDSFIRGYGIRSRLYLRSMLFPLLVVSMAILVLTLFSGCREGEVKDGSQPEGAVKHEDEAIEDNLEETALPIMIEAEPTWDDGDGIQPVSPDGLMSFGRGDEGKVEIGGEVGENTDRKGEIFTLQLGAFIFDKNLDRVRDGVSTLGYSPYIKEISREIIMYCPIIGRNMGKEEAEALMKALNTEGFDSVSIKGKGGLFDVASGLFYYEEDAKASLKKLEGLGYGVEIEGRRVEVTLKRLRIGSYEDIEDAKRDMNALVEKGFTPIIVNKEQ